ncbi:helix-turn-helix transcriptional regulator [uncultured Anaerotruncus sp.]|uniref:helix-turn-helix domain-containing protein n=1 Tax=uncultured Anaerotruncus sp. TaxID=905011 RepID=UPI00280B4A73|nr:helix-turn-helix transcriptional regulator [uncultured Anaerotruncus sp.]
MADRERFYLCLAGVLRALRAECGWGVSELSERCGVSERTIRRLERGTDTGRVRADTVMRIAYGMGVTPCEVFRRVDERMGE